MRNSPGPGARPDVKVRALWRRVALLLALAAGSSVAAAPAVVFVLGWSAGASPHWQRPSPLPLLLWTLATGLTAAWLLRLAGRARRWDRRSAAAEIERRIGARRGAVQGAVEEGLDRPGISRSLVEMQRARVARWLEGKRVAELGDAATRAARSYALAATAVVLLAGSASLLIWLLARPSASDAWAAVLHPVRQLTRPPLPGLALRPALERVRRGRDLPVIVRAPGRDSVRLAWQPAGEVARRRWYRVAGDSALAVVPRLEAPTLVWARAPDGAFSDTLRVEPVDPLLLLDLRVALSFPPHTGREREVLAAPLPAFSVPEGTRATVSGVASRPVASAALRSRSGRALSLRVSDGRRFRGSFVVGTDVWGWEVVGAGGEALEGEPDSLYFSTVADSVPDVRITFPGVDTVLSTAMTQPLLVEASDDYGLTRVELVSWRVSAWGEAGEPSVEPLALAGAVSRASLAALIDARGRGFLPGDTLRYFVRAFDNAPEPQLGKSREYVLRLPTLEEVRERAIAEARELVDETERLADKAREQQESLRALERSGESRRPAAADRRGGEAGSRVEFRETEEARQTLERIEQLLEDASEVQKALAQLDESIERAGLNDPTVLERLREIESLYERILTPELERAVEKFRDALDELDPERIRQAIEQLAEGTVDFREQVERSLELLRRAALEAEFQTLETETSELSEAEQRLAEAIESGEAVADSAWAGLENRAAELAQQAAELSERAGRLTEELGEADEPEAAEHASAAEQSLEDAARSGRQAAAEVGGRHARAGAAARQAASQMRQAAAALQSGRRRMQEGWRREVVAALERAQTEALELAERQQTLNERLQSGDPADRAEVRSEEVAIKRGVDQVGEQLSKAARSSLLLDSSAMEAARQAGVSLERLLGQLGDATRAGRNDSQFGRQAGEALNELAYRLMQAADAATVAQSGTGLQEALEKLAELAGQQGELNARTGGLAPGSTGDLLLRRLQALARQQAGIAEELRNLNQSMGPRGQVLGELDALAREAEDLAKALEQGRLDDRTRERQSRLFQRLLDAGRTLERDEYEKVRRAERPGAVPVLRPDALPPELLEGARFPVPEEGTLRRYPPAYRRLILEYFDRLNGRERAGGS